MTKSEIEKQILALKKSAWQLTKRKIKAVCKANSFSFRANCLWPSRYEVRDESKSYLDQRVENKEIDEIVWWYVNTIGHFYDCSYKNGVWNGGS